MSHTMNWKVTTAVLLLFAVYFPIATYFKFTYVPVPYQSSGRIWLTGPFIPLSTGGAAYIAALPQLNYLADTVELRQSTLILYEDEKPIGPANSDHIDISSLGNGRYSHWKDQGLIFSATDNSNPNQNWKRYSVTIGPK
jgi:hypothetical protein